MKPAVECFIGEIPDFVEEELARRYECLHSSLPFFRVYRSLSNVNCYVARRGAELAEILLFAVDGHCIDVLNEMIGIAPHDLKDFAETVFTYFPRVDLIRFHALDTVPDQLGFPVQHYNAKDTFVIDLPATPEDYVASLGKSTRASLRQQMNYARKNIPGFAVEYFTGEAIREGDLRTIARLSEDRINIQGANVRHDVERIRALAKQCGFVGIVTVDGRIRAGSINYRIGSSYFGAVIAFDPAYQRYGFGKLCTVETICESIRRGGRRFYLGGGIFGFKERLLGRKVDMDQLQIYRSRARLLANPGHFGRFFVQGNVRRLKRFVNQRRDSPAGKIVFKFFYAYQNKMSK
jgi:ribosomal protein S18 acetylase RimI-like enzyme